MNNKKSLVTVFLIVFIDLLGFGMIIPLHPYLAEKFSASTTEIGFLIAIYSIMQLIFAPLWGRLSDRIGRRPVILVSLLGASLAHLAFGFATNLLVLFLSRALAGIFGANISTAMASIADMTNKKNRSQYMGLIGAAFGLGFTLGPFFGAFLIYIGESLGSAPPFGEGFAAVGASLICFINLLMAIFYLKESRPQEKRVETKTSRWLILIHQFQRKTIAPLMLIFFFYSLALSNIELPLLLYIKDIFAWNSFYASLGFAYMGLVLVITQAFIFKNLLKKFGERFVLLFGLIFAVSGFFAIGQVDHIFYFATCLSFLFVGMGLISPSLNGCISLLARRTEQGETLGANQSLSALGRVIGPMIGAWLYSQVNPKAPFYLSGLLLIVGLIVFFIIRESIPVEANKKNDV